mgnify:FL=1|tara:strand:+ start:460 stop:639 length:180 start_codon:yes stop_codon:yes gene_type:complete
MVYKLVKSVISKEIVGVNKTVELENGETSTISIPADNANTDYKEYLKWVAEGNTPEEAE